MIDYYNEIYTRFGTIRRARGFYLYTSKNIRLIDMYLDGGQSILGRRTGQKHLVFKQFLDRGLTCRLPTQAEINLKKAVNNFFPLMQVRWYETQKKAISICESITAKPAVIWKPFLPDKKIEENAFVLSLPFPADYGVVVFSSELTDIPESDALFPPMLQTLARAFFDLAAETKKYIEEKQRANLKTISFKKKDTDKKTLDNLIPYFWEQKEVYLFPKMPESAYTDFFQSALDAHILIAPEYHRPSILPRLNIYTELINFLKTQRGKV
ncbi:hypothetical protein DWQ65_04570 [Treponema phagedenis]|uniref:Uncharacterized protein n=1 Tax=Treponema phagedenis TaxID=162 RepID=A0A0B7GT15_TREPH|nr:hypothetical protein [Treponema phagedenis]QEJ95099.1 hypothetical protein FUT79_07735 [Treponema phagedenis]QEK01024.1 hypothetical protein FUT84_07580 [Treponema phagedenis]QEK06032.1 hypothetical protein FUT80_04475 [Treponema phagedenis]QSH99346.1 hypothetical protein DWQ65_04570 [Treponema phagedenis]CEM61603.1 conserved hypothetical protein [Treponema phagedenis]